MRLKERGKWEKVRLVASADLTNFLGRPSEFAVWPSERYVFFFQKSGVGIEGVVLKNDVFLPSLFPCREKLVVTEEIVE